MRKMLYLEGHSFFSFGLFLDGFQQRHLLRKRTTKKVAPSLGETGMCKKYSICNGLVSFRFLFLDGFQQTHIEKKNVAPFLGETGMCMKYSICNDKVSFLLGYF